MDYERSGTYGRQNELTVLAMTQARIGKRFGLQVSPTKSFG